MPGFDRSGPLGQGPMTGRGMGRCGRGGGPGKAGGGFGRGRGGGRRGGGLGRGFAGGFAWGAGYGGRIPLEDDEKAWLQDRLQDLEQESRELRERLASYESEEGGE